MKPGMKANWEFGVNPTTIIIIIIISTIGGPLTALKIKFCAFIVNADLKSILNAKRAKMFTHLSTSYNNPSSEVFFPLSETWLPGFCHRPMGKVGHRISLTGCCCFFINRGLFINLMTKAKSYLEIGMTSHI